MPHTQQSLFPHRDTLKQVIDEGIASLPITTQNELIALMQLQQNTLLMLSGVELPATDPEYWQPDSHWDTHPKHDLMDWTHEVEEGDTRLGYVDWVNHQIEESLH